MIVVPTEVYEGRPAGDGATTYTDFVATDEQGRLCFCNIGWKSSKNEPKVGEAIDFLPYKAISYEPSNFAGGKRAPSARGGNPYAQRGSQHNPSPVPRSPVSAPANAPQGHPQKDERPSRASFIAGLRKTCEELGVPLTSEHASMVMLGRIRGDIKPDPTEAENAAAIEDARKAGYDKGFAEGREAAKRELEAQTKLDVSPMRADDDIPF